MVAVTAATLPWFTGIGEAAVPRLALNQPGDSMRPGTPAANADVDGMWSGVAQWPSVALHAVLDQDGQLVTYGAIITPDNTILQGGLQYDTWDPATGGPSVGSHVLSAFVGVDSFCSIAVPQQGNSLFVVGGNTQYSAGTYDPVTGAFTREPTDLQQPRWYGSMIRLPDDRMVIVGGSQPHQSEPVLDANVALTPEIYTKGQGWRSLTGATSAQYFGGAMSRWWYPKSFLAPNGKIFGISYDRMWQLDINGNNGTGAITNKGTISAAQSTALGPAASAVMFAPGKILLAGGNQISNMTVSNASTDAIVIDINSLSSGNATVTDTGSMHRGRNWNNLLALPDGTVIAVGGTPVGNDTSINPSLSAEVWDPATNAWTELAPATKPRSYHNSAVLLPNGSIYSGGGGAPGYPAQENSQENAEFFYPPYLFTKVGNQVQWASRPQITSMSGYLELGGQLQMDMNDNRAIESVSLITAGANTHSVSMSQRRIPLTFSKTGSVLTATLPTDTNQMPPGLYLLTATDSNGVPSPSQMIEINADGSPGKVTVYGQGAQVPPTSGITPPSTTTSTTTTSTTTTTTTTAPPVTVPAKLPATFTGTSPTRLLDTRPGQPALAHSSIELATEGSPAGPGSETVVQVTGVGPVPASGVGSVALNVTVTNPSSASFLTVYPTGAPRPTASNLNVVPGETVPNMVIVPVGSNGRVSIFNQSGTADVVVDVLGWFPSGGGFTGVTPARLADTRNLPTIDGRVTNTGPVGAAAKLTVPVAGRGGVPSNATAVALNVTATGATGGTYLTVFPTGKQRPTASNLNVTPGVTSPNMVIVPVGTNGSIDVFNSAGSTDVVVDVLGWFAPGSGFTGLTPARLMDTRADGTTVDGKGRAEGALQAGVARRLVVTGRGGVGANPGSVVLNVTVTEPGADGYLTVFPTGTQVPTASNLNFTAGQTIPNMVVVPVAADGTVSLFTNSGPVHVVVDVLGWFPTP